LFICSLVLVSEVEGVFILTDWGCGVAWRGVAGWLAFDRSLFLSCYWMDVDVYSLPCACHGSLSPLYRTRYARTVARVRVCVLSLTIRPPTGTGDRKRN
jgi:hypothetical protein